MSIEKVEERIINKGKKEAEIFLSEEKAKIDKEKKLFDVSKKEEFEKKRKEALLKIENEAKRKADRRKLEADREILSKKREMIDELFEAAIKKLSSLDLKTYKKFVEGLILKDAPKGKSIVMVNKKDISLFTDSILSSLNKKLGKDREISLSSKTVNIKGGCILKGNEIEIDDSIETLLSDEREQDEISIANDLFGEDK